MLALQKYHFDLLKDRVEILPAYNTLRNWYGQKSCKLVLIYTIKIKVPLENRGWGKKPKKTIKSLYTTSYVR